MVLPLLLIPITTLAVIGWLSYTEQSGNRAQNVQFLGSTLANLIKLLTLLSFNISLGYGAYLWKLYPIHTEAALFYPSNSWLELQHNLSLPFVLLSTFILILALLTAWYSTANCVLLTGLLLLVEICLVGAFSATNLFVFLLFFEASALPIFILIVYCGSPRRERLKASYYFLFFTLYGSVSLLLLILNIYTLRQVEFINNALIAQQTSYTM
jgi:NADH:ubiquinone oxidoreductase subunit 4 (subunit M)